jgi:hypothetical protein
VDVKDEAGKVTNWELELSSPNGLLTQGWKVDSLKPGDMVTVTGYRARETGKYLLNARRISLGTPGRSLATSLRAGREPDPRPIWSESVEYGPDRFALRDGRFKAIACPRPEEVHGDYRPRVRPIEVFDLEADPGETRDLSEGPDPDVRRLIARVAERAGHKLRGGSEQPGAIRPDDDLLRSLKSLGYVK